MSATFEYNLRKQNVKKLLFLREFIQEKLIYFNLFPSRLINRSFPISWLDFQSFLPIFVVDFTVSPFLLLGRFTNRRYPT